MKTVLESLNQSLFTAMKDDPKVIIMGEDILDPYGGAFKVTRGLSTQYPDRVITTPISEAGMVGIATGLALQGFKPVVEIMFGDFTTLIVDQVVNHLSKFRELYKRDEPLPMVIRAPMGGRRGYGPTHSQSLERLFFGISGIRVIAPTHIAGISGELLYQSLIHQANPTVFIENKLQYLLELIDPASNNDLEIYSPDGSNDQSSYAHTWINIKGAPEAKVTLFTYGYMLDLALKAMQDLAYSEEIFVNLCCFTQLSPFSLPDHVEDRIGINPILIVEEGSLGWGWGAEVAAQLMESSQVRSVKRLAAANALVPASPVLEASVLPQVADIITLVKRMRINS